MTAEWPKSWVCHRRRAGEAGGAARILKLSLPEGEGAPGAPQDRVAGK